MISMADISKLIVDGPTRGDGLELADTITRKGTNFRHNMRYVVENEADHIAEEWFNVMAHLRGLNANKLRSAPSVSRGTPYEGKEGTLDSKSAATGVHHRRGIDLKIGAFQGRVRRTTTRQSIRVSQLNHLYYLGVLQHLNDEPATFARWFEPRPIDERAIYEREQRDLKQLLLEGLEALSPRERTIIEKLMVDGEITSLPDLLKHAVDLVKGKEGFFYKLHKGDSLQTVESMLLAKRPIKDDKALQAVQRIRNSALNATAYDYALVGFYASQFVSEQLDTGFGVWKEKILYARKNDIGYKEVARNRILTRKFKPVQWYKRLSAKQKSEVFKEKTIRAALIPAKKTDELRLTDAEAQGILDALPGFEKACGTYMNSVSAPYFSEDTALETAVQTCFTHFAEDRKAWNKELQEEKYQPKTLPDKSYKIFKRVFKKIAFEYYEIGGNTRPDPLKTDLQAKLNFPGYAEAIDTFFVEAQKTQLAQEHKAKARRELMRRDYLSLTGKRKAQMELGADKLASCFIRDVSDNTPVELKNLRTAGFSNSAKLHELKKEAKTIAQEAGYGLVRPEYAKNEELDRAAKYLDGFNEVDADLGRKITLLSDLKKLGLKTEKISAVDGRSTELANERRFSMDPLVSVKYVSPEQRTCLEKVFENATYCPGIREMYESNGNIDEEVKNLGRLQKIGDTIQSGKSKYYDLAHDGEKISIEEVNNPIAQNHTARDSRDWEFFHMFQHAGLKVVDVGYVNTCLAKFDECIVLDRDLVRKVSFIEANLDHLADAELADTTYGSRWAGLFEKVKEKGVKVYVSEGWKNKIDEVYEHAQTHITAAEQENQALVEQGYDVKFLLERLERASNTTRVQEGKPHWYKQPYTGPLSSSESVTTRANNPFSTVPLEVAESLKRSLDEFEALEEFEAPQVFKGEADA
ncbi:MAG: hypothetical protein QF632_00975, partial [Candidatus Woesearchaeota archaeon]|nr:hypothetical protein [Candidatus Woesearchaeota archaeon]